MRCGRQSPPLSVAPPRSLAGTPSRRLLGGHAEAEQAPRVRRKAQSSGQTRASARARPCASLESQNNGRFGEPRSEVFYVAVAKPPVRRACGDRRGLLVPPQTFPSRSSLDGVRRWTAGNARDPEPPSFRPGLGVHHPAGHLCPASQAAVPFPGWSVLDPRFRERDGREFTGGWEKGDKFLGGLRTSVIPVLVTGIHSRGFDG
jgi:hypothetical protein